MGKALYRQYRSTSFDEVLGQEHITETLKNSLAKQSIGHAYLLSGPRGVGKTSVARILAHAVNDLPYEADSNHLDIIEIDAASNRRIDEIRSLRERVHIAPVSAKYKVYIIDEVHMLTKEAFNALLKTLEEPPAHVIFILATTDAHKLPDTIVSRCIRFTFRPIDQSAIAKHLTHIAQSEGITISPEAVALLAQHGDGSFRDSISLLDQVKNANDNIELADIERALGLAPDALIAQIFAAISAGDPKVLDDTLLQAYGSGASELHLAKQLAAYTRVKLLEQSLPFSSQLATTFLEQLLDVPASPKPRASLELTLLKLLFASKGTDGPSIAVPAPPAPVTPPKTPQPKPAPAATRAKTTESFQPAAADKTVVKTTTAPLEAVSLQPGQDVWPSVLQQLKTRNNTLYSIARMAQTKSADDVLEIGFTFPFHYKQINQPKNKALLQSVLETLGQNGLQLEIRLIDEQATASQKASPKSDEAMESITNIFGAGEVLES